MIGTARLAAGATALALVLVSLACGGEDGRTAALDRNAFVEVYVDLRLAALSAPSRQLTPERREEVLRTHGVTEQDVLAFVEAHGRDVDYMQEVWAEVEARMDSLEAPTGSGSG